MLPALLAAPATTFVLHAGQERTLSHARVGDSIVCTSVNATIGARVSGGRAGFWVWDRTLKLTVTPLARGGVRASCLTRS